MLGAIVGDIVGSRFEWHNHKDKEFDLFTKASRVTDDTMMTLAVADALLTAGGDYDQLGAFTVMSMQFLGQMYPTAGYGGHFKQWLKSKNPKPYNSYGNGAAMRVSPVIYAAGTLDEAKKLSRIVTEVTHNHPEGIKGAEATVVAAYMAKYVKDKEQIRDAIVKDYYPMDFTLDEIRPTYSFDVSCQGSVPHAIQAFLESTDFEDAIRNAISIGGDSDTIAAITGTIAGAFYGIPDDVATLAYSRLNKVSRTILDEFEEVYPTS